MTNKEAAKFIWDVLDGVKSFNEKGGKGLEALDLAIKALEDERPQGQGEWIIHNDYHENCRYGCNQCGNLTNIPGNFCPNCGVKMRVNKKETTFDDYLKKQLENPEFRKEWEKLCDENMQKGGEKDESSI